MAKNKNKSGIDIFGDDVNAIQSQDFASLFETSLGKTERRLQVGESFTGEILSIGSAESFVSTGTPIDAALLTTDLMDENKVLKFKVGDRIDVVVVKTRGDEMRVTRKGARGAPPDIDSLEDAFDMELPVEGKVTELVKGGVRVSVKGHNAFCPISQIDIRPVKDMDGLLGKRFEFIITQFEEKGRNIVVSRRKLLEFQRAENEGSWLSDHGVGEVVKGRVVRLESFGAFVELAPGIEGLVHVSEIGFQRVKTASEVLNLDQEVEVKILAMNDEEGRLKISLSIKQGGGLSDPWLQVGQKYVQGGVYEGTVENRANYGLFISLDGGLTGLLPRSKWQVHPDAKLFDNLKRGDKVKIKLDEIKWDERKLSLGCSTGDDDGNWQEYQNTKSFGTFADLLSKAGRKTES